MTKAVEQVRPSTKLLDDSMNINDYVKVKCIEHENISLTKYIQGHVMTYPWEGSTCKNPTILLLKQSQDLIDLKPTLVLVESDTITDRKL